MDVNTWAAALVAGITLPSLWPALAIGAPASIVPAHLVGRPEGAA